MQTSAAILQQFRSASPGPATSHPIDRAHLARYTMGDVELEREILDLFASQTWKTIAELRDAVGAREWRIAAHTLKGSARAVGAWDVAREAERAEHVMGDGDREAIGDAIERIERAAMAATAFVRHLATEM
jgi:HPt (histidine-containing phosphotransfer) domain-containing protein